MTSQKYPRDEALRRRQVVLANRAIGSGVTEVACKTLVKQRLCGAGMRWKEKGAGIVLSLRSLVKSRGVGSNSGAK